jgi:hypothetical protein
MKPHNENRNPTTVTMGSEASSSPTLQPPPKSTPNQVEMETEEAAPARLLPPSEVTSSQALLDAIKLVEANRPHETEEERIGRIDTLASNIARRPISVKDIAGDDLKALFEQNYNVRIVNDEVRLEPTLPTGNVGDGLTAFDLSAAEGRIFQFGGVSDSHLGSNHERLDVLNMLYDRFAEAGLKYALHGGNMIEGEFRFNKWEIHKHGAEAQVDYFVAEYPRREGITTYFVTGDDHEGWYNQRENLNIGRIIEERARASGRNDLVYAGNVYADFELMSTKGSAILRLMHPGGGSSYAASYTSQKQVEAFNQITNKPDILLSGHYHKAIYLKWLECHVVQLASQKEEDTFMIKKRIHSELGGWIIGVTLSPEGKVERFVPDFIGAQARPKAVMRGKVLPVWPGPAVPTPIRSEPT